MQALFFLILTLGPVRVLLKLVSILSCNWWISSSPYNFWQAFQLCQVQLLLNLQIYGIAASQKEWNSHNDQRSPYLVSTPWYIYFAESLLWLIINHEFVVYNKCNMPLYITKKSAAYSSRYLFASLLPLLSTFNFLNTVLTYRLSGRPR